MAGKRVARRIELTGGIGAGKSTLAAALAQCWRLPLVAERFEDVPYWSRFYADPQAFTLEKDLSFLLSHADSIRSVREPAAVCDFAMFQTVAYSAIVGDGADTLTVRSVFERMTARLDSPALVVRLTCDLDVQLARIAARGREPEAGITGDYLRALDAAIEAEMRRLPADVPVVTADSGTMAAQEIAALPAVGAAIRRALLATTPPDKN